LAHGGRAVPEQLGAHSGVGEGTPSCPEYVKGGIKYNGQFKKLWFKCSAHGGRDVAEQLGAHAGVGEAGLAALNTEWVV
jgi:hypothetical protein